jgi:Putative Flp pilus-assembly TadE/G-like
LHQNIFLRQRHRECGQTILLVAISLVALLAMAALAIDVVTLYVASSQVQRAADAAALAGAKAIADSGFTTLPSTDPNYNTAQTLSQTMATKAVDSMVGTSAINLVSGQLPVMPAPPTFDFTTHPGSFQITVSLKSANLPTFFSKIWSGSAPTVTASATAEAYNPANLQNFTPINPKVVKPWLVANADPSPGQGGAQFINPSNGAIETNVIGEEFYLKSDCQTSNFTQCAPLIDITFGVSGTSTNGHPQVDYVPALITADAGSNVCPGCAGASGYEQSIECADVTTPYLALSCGGGSSNIQWDNTVNPGGLGGLSDLGAECLIHATGTGNGQGQDILDRLPWPGNPMKITAQSGPQNGNLVTTSSSIVTIPLIDTASFPPSGGSVVIDGFMQAFIDQVHGGGIVSHQGDIQVTVLNIAGCSNNSTNSGVTPVVGGAGTSPVPVRLITPP